MSVCNQPPKPSQHPTLCGTVNEYRPKCDDALQLQGSKGRMANSTLDALDVSSDEKALQLSRLQLQLQTQDPQSTDDRPGATGR